MEFSSGQGKSYTCAFCKRGFSNAQALGGHMNIHRRDRAKLRQSFEENLLSLENSSMKNTTIDDDHDQPLQPLEEKVLFGGMEYYSGGDQQKHSSNDNKKYYKDDDYALQRGKEIIGTTSEQHGNHQLPLLIGMPSSMNDVGLENVEEEKKNDVDLELRLGVHEGPNLSTREFF